MNPGAPPPSVSGATVPPPKARASYSASRAVTIPVASVAASNRSDIPPAATTR